MKRMMRGALVALVLATVVPLSGCDIEGFSLGFSDLEKSSVDGIRLWEVDANSGSWVPVLELAFGEIQGLDGREFLPYSIPWGDSDTIDFFSEVERFGDGRTIRLEFKLLPLDQGDYRISSFNEFGDSPLSAGTYSL